MTVFPAPNNHSPSPRLTMKPLLLAAAAAMLAGPARAQAHTPPVPAGATLEFVANRGQWAAPVRYAAELPS